MRKRSLSLRYRAKSQEPLDKLLGTEAGNGFEGLSQLELGSSKEDIKKAYPQWWESRDEPSLDGGSKVAGKDLEAVVGAATRDSQTLQVPPVPGQTRDVTIFLTFKDDKLDYYWFNLSYGNDEALKKRYEEAVAATLGEPSETKGEQRVWVVGDEQIEVEPSDITKEWRIRVSKKE